MLACTPPPHHPLIPRHRSCWPGPPHPSRDFCCPDPRRRDSCFGPDLPPSPPEPPRPTRCFPRRSCWSPAVRFEFGLRPRVFLYNRVLYALVAAGHLDLALFLHRNLRADDLRENSLIFTILTKGLCCATRIGSFLHLLCRMCAEVCRPDLFAYIAMLKLLLAIPGSTRPANCSTK